MFDGLLIDYALALIISIAALYSFAQLGGIPRPSVDITHTDEDEPPAGLEWHNCGVLPTKCRQLHNERLANELMTRTLAVKWVERRSANPCKGMEMTLTWEQTEAKPTEGRELLSDKLSKALGSRRTFSQSEMCEFKVMEVSRPTRGSELTCDTPSEALARGQNPISSEANSRDFEVKDLSIAHFIKSENTNSLLNKDVWFKPAITRIEIEKLKFTRQEWKKFVLEDSELEDSELKELGWDHFVKTGHTYFKPGARGAIVTPRHFCFWLAWMVSQASTRKRPILRLTSTVLDATPRHHLHRGCSGSWSSPPS